MNLSLHSYKLQPLFRDSLLKSHIAGSSQAATQRVLRMTAQRVRVSQILGPLGEAEDGFYG
jgi:hypothetical protein